ncbi:AAA family ATPase [Vibrio parahaemolyticus]|uniref:AAA family ATPase n=1 Tax=Vibrio parahaemolyticus TaxID=670 RepID=A0AAW8PXU7_VIBPH|nr:AAA family ATPase [Vibrio parahaemolyticus]MDS1821052.1 AAA family ATPase [Vibrio parahaemolyticus]
MLKTISIGNYKQLNNIDIAFEKSFEDPTCILVGDTLSGKREALEVIPFLFAHTPSFQDQSACYHNSGVALHSKQNMTATDTIDFTLGFSDHTIHSSFKYEGDTYGSWIKTEDPSESIKSESITKAKLYSFTESTRQGFTEACSSYIKPCGKGLQPYLIFLAENYPEKLGAIMSGLMRVFPEITGVMVFTNTGNNFTIGDIEDSRCSQYESMAFFTMNNGMTYPLTHLPMSILTSLTSLVICASDHSSSLILIDEFDLHLDTNRAFKLLTELEALTIVNAKQLIVSTTKREFLMKPNAQYLECSAK